MTTININQEELLHSYLVKKQSTYEIADSYGVDVKVIRQALKFFGEVVRRGETPPIAEQTVITFTTMEGVVLDVDGNEVGNTTTVIENTTGTVPNWETPVISLYAKVEEPSFN